MEFEPQFHIWRRIRLKISKFREILYLVVCACLLSLITAPAFAAPLFTVTIGFDENCNGTFANSTGFTATLPCSLVNDPGPGGLSNAVFYGTLNPPSLVAGDVFIFEQNETVSDILRFNTSLQGGGVFVYSNLLGGSLADIGFPSLANTNVLNILEIGGGVSYTPTAGQPGFVTGAAGPVTYNFISNPVPEPATGLLLLAPLAAIFLRRRKQVV
jgi:hypothetical protein